MPYFRMTQIAPTAKSLFENCYLPPALVPDLQRRPDLLQQRPAHALGHLGSQACRVRLGGAEAREGVPGKPRLPF